MNTPKAPPQWNSSEASAWEQGYESGSADLAECLRHADKMAALLVAAGFDASVYYRWKAKQ